jgi:hypothetical protein
LPYAEQVGSYAFLSQSANVTTSIVQGSSYAGSGLTFAGVYGEIQSYGVITWSGGATISGTWRAMGASNISGPSLKRVTLFMRIA